VLHGSDCVQLAIHAFLETKDVESALRLAVSLGKGNGAAAAITGSIAEAYYQRIPDEFWSQCLHSLDKYLDEVLDVFFFSFMINRSSFEVRLGKDVLLSEAPDQWKRWPVEIDVNFTLIENFCHSRHLYNEYNKPSLYQSAEKLFQGEANDYLFPSYGVSTVGIEPVFEWYVSWPLQRRGGADMIVRRGKACGAEGWEATYKTTLVVLWSRPIYSNTRWCYIPSKGRLMLDVGGRTKQDAVNNWYLLAKPLRRILKEVRASRRQMSAEAFKRNGIMVKTEDDGGAS
jgi:hypothetical protein